MLLTEGNQLMEGFPRVIVIPKRVESKPLVIDIVGRLVIQPLAGGMLTGKYLDGIPSDSRMARDNRFLKPESLTDDTVKKVRALKKIADARGQKLQQLALQWVLRDEVIPSALIGASRPEQILDNAQILSAPPLTEDELRRIDEVLS